jgi:hypothetical protein
MHKEIVDLSTAASFTEVEDDIVHLLDSHSQPLNNEELAELDKLTMETKAAAATDDDEVEIHKDRGLTFNGL